jgi:hypothetical protein
MSRWSHLWAAVGLCSLLTFAQGCHLTFDVKAAGEATIPGSLVGQLTGLPGISNFASLDLSQTQDFKNQNVNKDHLQSVKTKSLVLSLKDPQAGQNFAFLDSIEFYAQLPNDDASKVRFAHKDAVPHDATTFPLDLDDAELLTFVVAPAMSITTSAKGRSPSQDTTIEVNVDFNVVAKL